ncbi:MAG: hypothetical protein DHS20C21_03730 [Gemmatimonadota bacterium]|nr:MAG: hypothetical protein DHS20C21_03730 [Gemmatimonadota bacterium]
MTVGRMLVLLALLCATLGAGPAVPAAQARSAPTMSAKVYDQLAESEALAQAGKTTEALAVLEELRKDEDDLSDYERAQLYSALGFVHFNAEEYGAGIDAYRKVLEQPDLPEAIESRTVYVLAQLLFQVQEYEESIAYLNRWIESSDSPGPKPYILLGQAYHQLARFPEVIAPVRKAIRIARDKGRRVEENWYLLLRAAYYETGDSPGVLEILEKLVQEYPRKDYWLHLSATYGQMGDEAKQLTAFEAAYLQGYLDTDQEVVLLAQLLIRAKIPYRAAVVLEKGLQDSVVAATAGNYRLLSQAWTMARDDRRSIAALELAAGLSDEGELDALLARSHLGLDDWPKAAEAARSALRKGVEREDELQLLLGMALFELARYEEAKAAFLEARSGPESRAVASQWIAYIDRELRRLAELREVQ